MKTILYLSLPLAVLLASCEGTPGPNGTQAEARCRVSNQAEAVSQLTETVTRASVSDADRAAAGTELAKIASQAGEGAANEPNMRNAVACRAISIRAYTAMLRIPAQRDGGVQGLHQQAADGAIACDALPAMQPGDKMACDLIRMWRGSIGAVQASDAIRAIGARASAAGRPPLTEDVSEADWAEVGRNIQIVHNDVVAPWPESAELRAQKSRVMCGYEVLMDSVRAWRSAPASPAAANALASHDQLEAALADAVGVPKTQAECVADASGAACKNARISELRRGCRAAA